MKEKKSLTVAILACLAALPALFLVRKVMRKMQVAALVDLAEEGLAEYCAGEGLERDEFGPPIVAADSDFDWAIEFQSSTIPRHIVIFYANGAHIVERHGIVE